MGELPVTSLSSSEYLYSHIQVKLDISLPTDKQVLLKIPYLCPCLLSILPGWQYRRLMQILNVLNPISTDVLLMNYIQEHNQHAVLSELWPLSSCFNLKLVQQKNKILKRMNKTKNKQKESAERKCIKDGIN